jgi:hypothetical protein
MAARVHKAEAALSREQIEATFEQEGLHPHEWANAPAGVTCLEAPR